MVFDAYQNILSGDHIHMIILIRMLMTIIIITIIIIIIIIVICVYISVYIHIHIHHGGRGCAMVDLFEGGPQEPTCLMSHWWGIPGGAKQSCLFPRGSKYPILKIPSPKNH